MSIKEALSILGLNAFADQEAVRAAYRKACIKYRPNKNQAGPEMMKAVNAAYRLLKETAYNGAEHPIQEPINKDFGDMLNDALNAVIGLDGVNISICGAWVWLSGNTKKHREAIKAAGYRWANKKAAWYFSPSDHTSRNKSDGGMDTHDSATIRL